MPKRKGAYPVSDFAIPRGPASRSQVGVLLRRVNVALSFSLGWGIGQSLVGLKPLCTFIYMIAEINTLEDLITNYPDDDSARKYFSHIRWGQWAECPFCGNKRAYFIENGKRYKCANKECYKKFSCTVKTVLECTNLSYDKWLKIIFLYAKTRGGKVVPLNIFIDC